MTILIIGRKIKLINNKAAAFNLKSEIQWDKFLSRHDMLWTVKPVSWDEGAFIGNGLMGAMIYAEEHRLKRNVLRLVMGRVDVTAKKDKDDWFLRRVPIGELDLEMEGFIYYGTTMRLELWNAELRAYIITTKGEVEVRAFVHSEEPVMVVEIKTTEGERNTRFKWYPYPEVDHVLKNADSFNLNQFIPNTELEEIEEDGVSVNIQKYSDKEGCTTGCKEVKLSENHRIFYLSILKDYGKNVTEEVLANINKASGISLEDYQSAHRNWWHNYYKQSFLSISDTRLEGFYWIQMYKLACATRSQYKIIDNQGPWLAPTPWAGTWFNMNVQMSYSPVYTSNHLDIGESLCRNLDENLENLIKNVPEEYQQDSAGLGRSCGYDLRSKVDKEIGNLAWTCHNYWRQYRYSMDEDMLRNRLYPLLRRCINYYLHILKKGEDGKYHLPESISPEYGSFLNLTVEDCTYDLSLLRWGCETLIKICSRLTIEDSLLNKWQEVLENLMEYSVDESGLMIGKGVPLGHGHRHFSHLQPIFPLHLIKGDSEEEKELILKSLRHWFSMEGDLRGFTFTGAASIAASIGRGNEALQYVKTAMHLFKPNTMYKEAGPVIESPLAAAESMNDMLLQSWGDTIRVFTAVPEEWEDVTIQNFRTEGAFLISAVREKGRTRFVHIKSLAGEPCKVKTGIEGNIKVLCEGNVDIKYLSDDLVQLEMNKGDEVILYSGDIAEPFRISPVEAQKSLCNYFGGNKPWRLYSIPFEN